MKILVTGANGLVGSHFVENYLPDSKTTNTILSPNKNELDITDQKSVENFFKVYKPEAVIHFAAFTDVSAAEEERENKNAPCWTVNVEGIANLIKAVDYQPYFIYISTDVVFSGSKDNPGPYAEDHPPEQDEKLLSWYGWTKREAEILVSKNLKNAAILRIANPSRAKYNQKLDYVRKILRLYDTNQLYPMFDDQYLTLTYINEVTKTLKILLKDKLTGVFHASSTNVFTPYKLANLLIEKVRGKKNAVKPVSIEPFLKDNPSRYPKYGGLNVERTEKLLGLKFMQWEEIIEDLAKQLSA
ncbi:NAD(P)-dependent oxidoreductase [Candidatus Daviesbacteria bacterium]|nr:NAD(P)-dependent oxidoreductase [Candidatus Daviesbacteria bacterium]